MLRNKKVSPSLKALLKESKSYKMTKQEEEELTVALAVAFCNYHGDEGATPETIRAARTLERATARRASKKAG